MRTYFSLLKGFIATGILYMPKNFKNAGWVWAGISMFASYVLTLICINKLLQARANFKGSFTELGEKALGLPGRYMVDTFLVIMQIGFLIGQIYFIANSLSEVFSNAFDIHLNIWWFGLICFVITTPLSFVRKIEKFAFSHVFADILIFVTTIVILVFAGLNVKDNGWGEGV